MKQTRGAVAADTVAADTVAADTVAAGTVAAGTVAADMVAAGMVANMVAAGMVPNMVAAGTGQALSDMAADTVAADTAQDLPDTVAAGIWVTGCSAIAPLPTWLCNRNSGCAIPRRILRFGLALVAWRSRPRLVRTAVLALRPL